MPSVSADRRRAGEVVRAADWLADHLRRSGVRVRRLPTEAGRDVVVGEAGPHRSAPTVVIYGHYDVRPAGRGWTGDAFVPRRDRGLLYGRGTNDDKGQLLAHVAALAAWCRIGGPPVRVAVVAEGAEEIGSHGLSGALARWRLRARPDVVLVSDTERAGRCTPAVVISQRGALHIEIVVDAGGHPVHAGRLGGAAVDPSAVLMSVLASIRRGLPCWAPAAPLPAAVPVRHRSDAAVIRAARGRAVVGARLDRRLTHGAAVSITDLLAGDGSGAAPSLSRARLDVRLPPGREPGPVLDEIRRAAHAAAPPGVRVGVRSLSAHRGSILDPQPWLRTALGVASRTGFGRPPAYLRSGGSIPAVGVLRDAFGRDPVLLGLGTPAGNAHGPQEHLDIAGWHGAVRTCVALLAALGDGADRTTRRMR